MRALRWHGSKDVRLDTVPEPELRPGWVKVKNAWCGICGSELTEWRVGPKNVPYDKPHILTGETLRRSVDMSSLAPLRLWEMA